MKKRIRRILFLLFTICAALAAIYHIKGFFYPTALTPAWRHLLFVFINIICIYGFLERPFWFIWFIGILTLQQWYSHGAYALGLWKETHTIHWLSIAVIILLPFSFILLLFDNKKQ